MIYLDNAATSYPKPDCVYERVDEVLRKIGGNPGRGSHRLALEASRVVFSARESLARLLGVEDSSRLVFTKNATESVNLALKGLLSPGDHAITTSFEHNSVARTLMRLEGMGVKVTRVAGKRHDLVEPGDIEKAITKKTKLAAVVWASNVLGTIEPVREIGALLRKKGILFMVDAAQTVGAIPTTVKEIDILVGTGHKALFGPQGVGFLYLREGLEPEPLIDGGVAEADSSVEMPEKFETGTLNTPGIGGLHSGIEFILEEGLENIRRREELLTAQTLDGLKKIKGVAIIGPASAAERASLVSFNIEGKDPYEVGVRLDGEFSIMTRCGMHCAPWAHKTAGTYPRGAVRVSAGYFNTPEEIEKFLKAVSAIAK